ncbi:MAG: hypothetical protein RL641_290 [Candidatus Parcubacteria bacterium]
MLTPQEHKAIHDELHQELPYNMSLVSGLSVVAIAIFFYHADTLFPLLKENFLSEPYKEVTVICFIIIGFGLCYLPFAILNRHCRKVEEMSQFSFYTCDDIRREVGLSYDKNNLTPSHRPDEKEIYNSRNK